jgi:protein-disulfide isomerase
MKKRFPRAHALLTPAPALTILSFGFVLNIMTATLSSAEPLAESPVARIDGKPIPYAELAARTRDKLALEQREYDAQLKRLSLSNARARSKEQEGEFDKLIDEHVLALEAAARKTTAAALLNAVKAAAPTDAELHAFYDEHRADVSRLPFEAVKPQIEEYLQGEASDAARQRYLETLRDKYHAVLGWEPLREQLDASGPERGPADARITIVEFSDFQCPYCRRLAPILKQLQDANPTQVRLVFRNLPLRTLHPDAARAAQAGVCANSQGKFWEMHDAMYADQSALGEAALDETALRLGLDPQAFKDCMKSAEDTAIKTDEAAAERLGLSGTPISFVNGRYVNGAQPLSKWQALIDDELRRTASR